MALPTFRAVGVSAGEGAAAADATITLPTHEADDILLLFIETSNEAAVVNSPAGWVEVTDSPQSVGSGGTATRLTIFWKRAASAAETNPVIEGTALNHVIGFAASFDGCITSGNPWDVTSGGTTTASSTQTMAGDTTTAADCLIVIALAQPAPDSTAENSQFSSWANADLANVTERFDASRANGNGGAMGMATGEKATAGAYGNSTVTSTQAVAGGFVTIALKPPVAAAAATRSIMYARRRGR